VTKQFADLQTGVYVDSLQTHSLMPLASGLVPASLVNKTEEVLAHQIQVTDKGHLDTGLTGTYFLTKYLMESGRNDLLFTIANQTTFPGYGRKCNNHSLAFSPVLFFFKEEEKLIINYTTCFGMQTFWRKGSL
jgi:hypothetical protein